MDAVMEFINTNATYGTVGATVACLVTGGILVKVIWGRKRERYVMYSLLTCMFNL